MNKILERLSQGGIVPVIKVEDPEQAVPLANALADGGVACAEITFRTQAADAAIRRICTEQPEMLVGAGTVLHVEQVDRAMEAGAKFIVSPGLNPAVVERCMSCGIPVIPGVMTPTEIERAMGYGLNTLKFFPAELAGGIAFLKAVTAVYSKIRFIPTGGITLDNLETYLQHPKVLACGGSYMCTSDLISTHNWAEITERCKRSISIVRRYRM